MRMTKAALDVCAACKHDPGCIYEPLASGTVLECEQFEMGIGETAARPPSRGRGVSGHALDGNGYAGLCANCENRETCIYPKPEGGVWRCEEYS